MNHACYSCLILTLLVVFVLESDASGQTKGELIRKTTFSEIKGLVVNSNGEPIKKFTAVVSIRSQEGVSDSQVLKNFNGEFENGEFQFEVEEPIEYRERGWISLSVTSPGYVNEAQKLTRLSKFDGVFPKTTLRAGVEVTGKVILNDSVQGRLIGPSVSIAKVLPGFVSDDRQMFYTEVAVNDDGSFVVFVPESSAFEILAYSQNGAAHLKTFEVKKVGETVHSLGDIVLAKGVSIEGTVLTKDGSPAAGQIVHISHSMNANNRHRSMVVNGSSVSDSEGRFKLPPRVGRCTISLEEKSHDGSHSVANVLVAKPIVINLKQGEFVEPMMIHESAARTISGTITDRLGSRPSNISAWAKFGTHHDQLQLDSDGGFEFTVPEGIEATISFSFYGVNGGSKVVSIAEEQRRFVRRASKDSRSFTFNAVKTDITALKFKLIENAEEN